MFYRTRKDNLELTWRTSFHGHCKHERIRYRQYHQLYRAVFKLLVSQVGLELALIISNWAWILSWVRAYPLLLLTFRTYKNWLACNTFRRLFPWWIILETLVTINGSLVHLPKNLHWLHCISVFYQETIWNYRFQRSFTMICSLKT